MAIPDGWIIVKPMSLDIKTLKLIEKIKHIVNCNCNSNLVVALPPLGSRSIYVECLNCGIKLSVKRFDKDSHSTERNKMVQLNKEKTGIELIQYLGEFEKAFAAPKVLGIIEEPYYVIIEKFIEGKSLRQCLHQGLATGCWKNVYEFLSLISIFFATLHQKSEAPSSSEPPLSLSDPINIINIFKNHISLSQCASYLFNQYERWFSETPLANDIEVGNAYDGFSLDHFFINDSMDQITVIDAESLRKDACLVDIGAVCAELKLFFSWYASNEYASEKFISFFLQDYLGRRFKNTKMNFMDFCRYQAFFMGRRFIQLTQLTNIVDSDRFWFLQTASSIWSILDKPCVQTFDSQFSCKAVLFDFYNTLVYVNDDEGDIKNFEAVKEYICRIFNRLPETLPSANTIRNLYYKAIHKEINDSKEMYPDVDLVIIWVNLLSSKLFNLPMSLFPMNNHNYIFELLRIFREKSLRRFEPVDNLHHVFEQIKNKKIKIGILTDAQASFVKNDIKRLGIIGSIDYFIISSDLRYRKPDRRIFEQAAIELKFKVHECLFVGDDMFRDIYGAQNAGMKAVYIESANGRRFYSDCIPDFIIKDLRQVLDIIKTSV